MLCRSRLYSKLTQFSYIYAFFFNILFYYRLSYYSVLRILDIFQILVLIRQMFCKYSLPFYGVFFFTFLRVRSEVQKFNFNEVQFIFVAVVVLVLSGVISKKPLLIQVHEDICFPLRVLWF